MTVKVLIVDDSGFFRRRIEEILRTDVRIQVVGTASNGREAVDKARSLKPDVITMDVEMPQLNGIEAVRIIMREAPTSVLMLSSLTHEGAMTTLEALDAGAADYLPKDLRRWMDRNAPIRDELVERVLALGYSRRVRAGQQIDRDPGSRRQIAPQRSTQAPARHLRPQTRAAEPGGQPRQPARPEPTRSPAFRPHSGNPPLQVRTSNPARVPFPDCRLLVIGTSTGGPAALQRILTQLPEQFSLPLMLVQHMPRTFTRVFAERLDQQCRIRVREAQDGDRLEPGLALLAPGGLQMMVDPRQQDRVRVLEGDARLTYKPSVDVTYASAARTYGARVLALILTGMGADGSDGARLLKREGATVWAQNRESSTIFGMPQAVINAGLADAVLDLDDIGPLLARQGRRG